MDHSRFDGFAKSLALGVNRRSVLRGLLGLGATTLVAEPAMAARRPEPTPKPLSCPGNQIVVNGQCECPDDYNKCGPACCFSNEQCCDNACCYGTCYGEELCCPAGQVVCNGICCQEGEICGEVGCELPPAPDICAEVVCDDSPRDAACHESSCDPETGACVYTQLPEGTRCDTCRYCNNAGRCGPERC